MSPRSRGSESWMIAVPIAILLGFIVYVNGGVDASLRSVDNACRSFATSASRWFHSLAQ